jgi:hypothetical protein
VDGADRIGNVERNDVNRADDDEVGEAEGVDTIVDSTLGSCNIDLRTEVGDATPPTADDDNLCLEGDRGDANWGDANDGD